jgi:hypothetical protein
VRVAIDAAELVIGFEHPGGAPAQRHGAVSPPLDVLGVLPADLDHGFDGYGLPLRTWREAFSRAHTSP